MYLHKKKLHFFIYSSFYLLIVCILSSCTHPLEIKNLHSYSGTSFNTLEKQISIGIISNSNDIYAKRILREVATGLSKYSAKVVYPYHPGGNKKVDYLAKVSVNPEYKGSGLNFLINWPGFIIFAPAWNGYIYEVNYYINAGIIRDSDKKEITNIKIPIKLDVRHASFNRTWTEISWFEVSAIAFIGGIVFTQYDNSLTPLVIEKVESQLGDYVAQEMVSSIKSFY